MAMSVAAQPRNNEDSGRKRISWNFWTLFALAFATVGVILLLIPAASHLSPALVILALILLVREWDVGLGGANVPGSAEG